MEMLDGPSCFDATTRTWSIPADTLPCAVDAMQMLVDAYNEMERTNGWEN